VWHGGIIGRIGFFPLYSYKSHAAFSLFSGFLSSVKCFKTAPTDNPLTMIDRL
jgi:hypothetical protein